MKSANFFFPVPIEQLPAQKTKMLEAISQGVRGFRHDPAIIKERRINPAYGVVDAYEHLAPVIDTDECMSFLKSVITSKGANLITRTITGDLFNQESALRAEFSADVIINCTGLAGMELGGDGTCYPIHGALLRVLNDGVDFPKLDHALSISADVRASNEIVFLVPRNDNILLIGGIAESHKNNLDLTLDSPIIKRMRARAEAFLPDLKNARLDGEYPLAQGLRPFRQRNVRVERELRSHSPSESEASRVSRIVHCYGHGGAGWSLSFGCAADVLALVKEALLDIPPKPMGLRKGVEARTSRL
jgi:glycine/D-amino acid oxidase-like deaminating enzyme